MSFMTIPIGALTYYSFHSTVKKFGTLLHNFVADCVFSFYSPIRMYHWGEVEDFEGLFDIKIGFPPYPLIINSDQSFSKIHDQTF